MSHLKHFCAHVDLVPFFWSKHNHNYYFLQIPVSCLIAFAEALEVGYSKYKNPYHNLIHAADVTQTVHYIMLHTGIMVRQSLYLKFVSLEHQIPCPSHCLFNTPKSIISNNLLDLGGVNELFIIYIFRKNLTLKEDLQRQIIIILSIFQNLDYIAFLYVNLFPP